MNKHAEFELRERFEIDRVKLLASRLLSLSGARFMVISLDDKEQVSISCSTGWLSSLSDYVGDALCESDDLESPLRDIV